MPMTRLLACALVIALSAGCARGPTLAKVTGSVTYKGKAIGKGSLTFESVGQRPASARIENGEIVGATTYQMNDGVPVGMHKIAVAATEEAASAVVADPGQAKPLGADYMAGKSLIPARYNDPETSGLTAEIKPGENRLELKLIE